jgi:hypothetical protein
MKFAGRWGIVIAGALLVACDDPRSVGTDMIVLPATASKGGAAEVKKPVLAFEDTLMNFGVVSEGHVVTHTFSFVNHGPGPALIADVSTSCGCTVPKTWPREPLAPGERGSVEVSFDTHEKGGEQDKVISVVGNTDPGVTRLHLVGTVLSPDAQ